jgi:hypothetical protein
LVDCAGDCGAYGPCPDPLEDAPVILDRDSVQVFRVGELNAAQGECGRYYRLLIATRPSTYSTRVTVSPPWRLSTECAQNSGGQCLAFQNASIVVVSTDVEAPPPRNVVIEGSEFSLACP